MKIFKNQDGVTLVIAIVLLGAVTFVSFSMGAVILREIRSARLVLATEPAIGGANSGGEVGLFMFQRGLGSVTGSGQLQQSGADFEVVADLYDDPHLFSVPSDEAVEVGLYDAENPENQNVAYRSVTITNNAGSPAIMATFTSWSGIFACPPGLIIPAGQSSSCILNGPDFRYVVEITRQGVGASTGSLQAFDDSAVSQGIPSSDPTLRSKGKSGETQRLIEINLGSLN